MSILTTAEFRKKLASEAAQAQEELHVVSAFCKKDAIAFIDSNLRHVLKSKKLLVRFLKKDVICGATDLDLYDYCKSNGWQLYIRFDLHAKTYIFDKKRYILGSGNLTSSGLGLNCLGNYELSSLSEMNYDDLTKVDMLFDSAVLMTDELFSKMREDIDDMPNLEENARESWCKDIVDRFKPSLDILFTYDFPSSVAPNDSVSEYEFLELSGHASKGELKDAFRLSKAFLWLYDTVRKKDTKECYFGELTAVLHNKLINDPKPYRKEVKDLLANLLGWVEYFDFGFIKVDRPNYSQRIYIEEENK